MKGQFALLFCANQIQIRPKRNFEKTYYAIRFLLLFVLNKIANDNSFCYNTTSKEIMTST